MYRKCKGDLQKAYYYYMTSSSMQATVSYLDALMSVFSFKIVYEHFVFVENPERRGERAAEVEH